MQFNTRKLHMWTWQNHHFLYTVGLRGKNSFFKESIESVFSLKTQWKSCNNVLLIWVVKLGCYTSRAASPSWLFSAFVGLSALVFCWPDEPRANPVFCWVRFELAPRSNESCHFTFLGCLLPVLAGSVTGINIATTGLLVGLILTRFPHSKVFKELWICILFGYLVGSRLRAWSL